MLTGLHCLITQSIADCCVQTKILQIPQTTWHFFTSWVTICFSKQPPRNRSCWFKQTENNHGVHRGGGVNPPKFRSFDKAKPNSLFRGKYIHNNLIRIRVSIILKIVGYRPQIPVICARCHKLILLETPPPPEKILGTPLKMINESDSRQYVYRKLISKYTSV
jgi:hypothetical protein